MPAMLQDTLPDSLAARLTDEQRQAVIEAPRGMRLAALVSALSVDENTALSLAASSAGLDVAMNLETDPGARGLFPARLIHDFQIIPILFGPQVPPEELQPPTPTTPLHFASAWLPDASMADWLGTFTPRPLVWHLAVPERVHQLIIENFGVGSGALEDSDEGYVAPEAIRDAEADVDEEAAVVRFVTDVITQAVDDQATDIHFEPQEGQLRIRYRVDGLLVPVSVPENLLRFQDAIISRVKIMARLNISERRLPQDGRINFKAAGRILDIRVSTIPTIYAESISLRLLNKKEAYTMDRLGMSADEQSQIKQVLDYPHGIILVTGPTGSGKSTSLNAFLRQINSTDLRIITIEDPIEYEVPGVNQMQVHSEIGLTFASALRHVLRQDPDVIMVGEIRDRETADIAIRASLTGHLVFSTLHTNDAPGAITRLVDMGIEPFLVASAIELVIAQRLVRRLCPECNKSQPVTKVRLLESLAILGCNPAEADSITHLQGPVGCDRCRGTGYRGRIGLFEIFRLNEEMHSLVLKRESTRTLALTAREHGMRTLGQSGWEKVKAGHTTLDEVLRVITIAEQ
ncbi:MAG TPA: GspE/PulE family protein [Opitutaceae bacterium]|jgi:type II secretory ATPase GspE/PulE/Tfp pilus assembly ATPase PilB-like protein|nr:GspE/PulE family protein [Opitutaceae bacterium]